MGGAWDATNVADGAVAVVLPISVDHASYLGDTPRRHRHREGRHHQARLAASCRRAGARGARRAAGPRCRGRCHRRSVKARSSASSIAGPGRRWPTPDLRGLRATYEDVFLPLYGEHQAQNAAVALAAVEAFAGRRAAGRRHRRRGLRCGDLARSARGGAPQPDDRARRRAQSPWRRGRRGRPGGLLRVLSADRRHRRDGGQGLRGRPRRVRTPPRPLDLHAELPVARDAAPRSWPTWPARSSKRTASVSWPTSPAPSDRRRPRWPRQARRSAIRWARAPS